MKKLSGSLLSVSEKITKAISYRPYQRWFSHIIRLHLCDDKKKDEICLGVVYKSGTPLLLTPHATIVCRHNLVFWMVLIDEVFLLLTLPTNNFFHCCINILCRRISISLDQNFDFFYVKTLKITFYTFSVQLADCVIIFCWFVIAASIIGNLKKTYF